MGERSLATMIVGLFFRNGQFHKKRNGRKSQTSRIFCPNESLGMLIYGLHVANSSRLFVDPCYKLRSAVSLTSDDGSFIL